MRWNPKKSNGSMIWGRERILKAWFMKDKGPCKRGIEKMDLGKVKKEFCKHELEKNIKRIGEGPCKLDQRRIELKKVVLT